MNATSDNVGKENQQHHHHQRNDQQHQSKRWYATSRRGSFELVANSLLEVRYLISLRE